MNPPVVRVGDFPTGGSSKGGDVRIPFATTRSSGALPGLDHAYHQQLAALSRVRRAVAAAATAQKQLELQLGQMTEHEAGDHGEVARPDSDLRLESLRHRYTAAQEKAERLFAASQRLQVKIEAFRLAKEATEAAYVQAQDALHATQAEIAGNV
jgi:chromosome segregation ATPase